MTLSSRPEFWIFGLDTHAALLTRSHYILNVLYFKLEPVQSFLLQLAYWFCTAVTIVPQKLLEFRYFMMPFMLLQLFSIRKPPFYAIIYNLAITTATLYVFQTKGWFLNDHTLI